MGVEKDGKDHKISIYRTRYYLLTLCELYGWHYS